MSTSTSSPGDQAVAEIVGRSAPTTISDVIAQMEAIDALLGDNDGLKWFNKLYLHVTRQIASNPPGGAWQAPAWLTLLDVVFAGYYFNALRDHLIGLPIPAAWTALFEARFRPGIDRIQFAVSGMNAHINRDLALALLTTNARMDVVPAPNGPEHADFEAVNTILNSVMPTILTMLASDELGLLAEDCGKVGRLLAFWNICRARDLAWDFSNHLRALEGLTREFALDAQDSLTGALGRAILTAL